MLTAVIKREYLIKPNSQVSIKTTVVNVHRKIPYGTASSKPFDQSALSKETIPRIDGFRYTQRSIRSDWNNPNSKSDGHLSNGSILCRGKVSDSRSNHRCAHVSRIRAGYMEAIEIRGRPQSRGAGRKLYAAPRRVPAPSFLNRRSFLRKLARPG